MSEAADDPTATDADLVLRSRSGDARAYGELWRRHHAAGIAVARSVTSSIDPDDLVQEAFTRIFQAIRRGGGPTGAFRAYLFTAIRNTAASWGRGRRESAIDELDTLADPASTDEARLEELDRGLTHRAFRSLPTRWQEVLWYTEVEGLGHGEAASRLGMKAGAVKQLAFRAREGLREAWIQVHITALGDGSECRWTVEHLGAHARGNLAGRNRARIEAHLEDCGRCALLATEAQEVGSRLALALLPLAIGVTATASYLASLERGGAAVVALAAMPSGAAAGGAAAGGTAVSAGTFSLGGLVGTGVTSAGLAGALLAVTIVPTTAPADAATTAETPAAVAAPADAPSDADVRPASQPSAGPVSSPADPAAIPALGDPAPGTPTSGRGGAADLPEGAPTAASNARVSTPAAARATPPPASAPVAPAVSASVDDKGAAGRVDVPGLGEAEVKAGGGATVSVKAPGGAQAEVTAGKGASARVEVPSVGRVDVTAGRGDAGRDADATTDEGAAGALVEVEAEGKAGVELGLKVGGIGLGVSVGGGHGVLDGLLG
ncbi:sigma-70 family RNA polymerase sigma factor [Microbacterium rhizophilus]|uniref:sigma-70 family RNA polymerase sigma factor n=1 Tax=Microbacterium rhizophilus TaxID=3138934 RepID=UPI0031ECB979